MTHYSVQNEEALAACVRSVSTLGELVKQVFPVNDGFVVSATGEIEFDEPDIKQVPAESLVYLGIPVVDELSAA